MGPSVAMLDRGCLITSKWLHHHQQQHYDHLHYHHLCHPQEIIITVTVTNTTMAATVTIHELYYH